MATARPREVDFALEPAMKAGYGYRMLRKLIALLVILVVAMPPAVAGNCHHAAGADGVHDSAAHAHTQPRSGEAHEAGMHSQSTALEHGAATDARCADCDESSACGCASCAHAPWPLPVADRPHSAAVTHSADGPGTAATSDPPPGMLFRPPIAR